MKKLSLLLFVFVTLCVVGCITSEAEIERHPSSDISIVTTLEIAVRNQYATQFELGDVTDQLYVLRYFGTFNDASILIVADGSDGVLSVGETIWIEEVGGLVFSDNIWLPIRVYYNGVFMSLTAAYESGIVDLAMLQVVHDAYI